MTEGAVPAEQLSENADSSTEENQLTVNRREFLNLAWLASLGFLTLSMGGMTILFSYPRFKEGEFGGIFNFGTIGDLPEQNSPPENFPKVKFWLSNTADGLLALYKVCPHLGCIFAWNDQEFKFICPCHGSQYQYNGTYIQGPAPRSLDRFVIRIEDENGQVLAETPENGGPVPLPDNTNAVVTIDTGDRILGAVHD